MRTARANGEVYAFLRATGEVSWHNPVENQRVLLDQFADLPVVIFSALVNRPLAGPGGPAIRVAATVVMEKRTGKRNFMPRDPPDSYPTPQQGQFHTLRVDRARGTADLIANTYTLRIYAGELGAKAEFNPPGRAGFFRRYGDLRNVVDPLPVRRLPPQP
jgi:hypothetical protein